MTAERTVLVHRLVQAVLSGRPPGDRRTTGRLSSPSGEDVALVCIDGVAGAGKTTLAGRLCDALVATGRSVAVVHMDDLYEGWGGLLAAHDQVRALVEPLRHGDTASYRRYDWIAGARAETVVVPPVDVLLLEGCGSAPPPVDAEATLTIFIDAPDELRLARGLARDGDHMREDWLAFMADERALAARDRTRARADVVLDGTGRTLRWRSDGAGEAGDGSDLAEDLWEDRSHAGSDR